MADPPVSRIRGIMFKMLSIVASIYGLVGVLGYSAFKNEIKGGSILRQKHLSFFKFKILFSTSGNMLLNYESDGVLKLIKLGFAMSVVVGFPLMIYPCRQSIFTLFIASKVKYKSLNDDSTYIPNSSKFWEKSADFLLDLFN